MSAQATAHVNRYRSPAQRDAARDRHYAKRMVAPPLTNERPPSKAERLTHYFIKRARAESSGDAGSHHST